MSGWMDGLPGGHAALISFNSWLGIAAGTTGTEQVHHGLAKGEPAHLPCGLLMSREG